MAVPAVARGTGRVRPPAALTPGRRTRYEVGLQTFTYLIGFALVVYLDHQTATIGNDLGPIVGYMIGVMAAAFASMSKKQG
jgi:hypothetical protein